MLQSDPIREAILSANQKLIAAVHRGDPSAIADFYTPEAQLLPTGADAVIGPAAISDFWETVFAMGVKDIQLQTLEVDAQGATAIEMGQYNLFLDGGKVADRGKYIVVWKLTGDDWKLHRDIWNTSLGRT